MSRRPRKVKVRSTGRASVLCLEAQTPPSDLGSQQLGGQSPSPVLGELVSEEVVGR